MPGGACRPRHCGVPDGSGEMRPKRRWSGASANKKAFPKRKASSSCHFDVFALVGLLSFRTPNAPYYRELNKYEANQDGFAAW